MQNWFILRLPVYCSAGRCDELLWIGNLGQYSLLGRGFCSENAYRVRVGNFEAVNEVMLLSSDFFSGLEIAKNQAIIIILQAWPKGSV